MPSFCVVSNCEHKYSHSENVSFHKFPHQSKETLQKWITFADRGVDWKPSKWSAICSRHFLPSDFRDLASRKSLKRDAVPSVTMKQFNFDLLNFHCNKDYELKLGDNEFISNCRLCGNLSKIVSSFSSNNEIFLMIKKCFPTLNIQQNDDLPKSLCSNCSQKLHNFSDFIDTVSRTQKEFEDKFLNQQQKNLNPNENSNNDNDNTNDNNSNNNNSSNNIGKLLKIKQEPLVKIKQEISDTVNSNNNNNNNGNNFDILNDDNIDNGPEETGNDHSVEQKSQINTCLSVSSTSLCTNSRDINNCEIMEIISLEDAFIDIPDDDYIDNDINKLEFKIPRINPKKKVILMERDHNYATKSLDTSIITNYNYKTEKFDENDIKLNCRNNTSETLKLNEKICTINKGNLQGIVVINERIVEPISAVNNNSPATNENPISFPFVTIPSTSSTVDNLYQYNYCNECNMQFLSEKVLEEHITKCHHASINDNKSNRLICSICNCTFGKIHDFLKHKNIVHGTKLKKSVMKSKKKFGVHPCLNCNKLFMNKLALNNHRKYICIHRENQFYECKFCNAKIKQWISLKSHERICKKKIKTEDNLIKKRFICKNIGEKNFIMDKMIIPNNLKPNPNNDGRYPCAKCGRSYTRQSNLYKHMKKHRPIDQWNLKCGYCERLFDRIHDLRQHLSTKDCVGNDGRQLEQIFYVCIICSKEFKTIQRLETHIAIHSGKKPYVCEKCGKAFPCFNNLHQHRITHTDLRRYKCELCEKVFKRKGGLNQHNKAFHLKLRPYECPVCKHCYALKNDMSRCRHSKPEKLKQEFVQ